MEYRIFILSIDKDNKILDEYLCTSKPITSERLTLELMQAENTKAIPEMGETENIYKITVYTYF